MERLHWIETSQPTCRQRYFYSHCLCQFILDIHTTTPCCTCTLQRKIFTRIAPLFRAFAIRASDIITAHSPYTDPHATFNILLQLYNDIVDVILLQRHRINFDILAPEGWTDPPVRRAPIPLTQQVDSHTTIQDNNNSSNSQVNVLDVRSTPSTYHTSLCTRFISSPGSPAVPLGTLKDPWKGMNKLELPEEHEFLLPTNHGSVLNLFENTYEFHIREYQGLIDTQCSTEFLSEHPELMTLFLSDDVTNLFVPKRWSGILGIPPIKLTFSEDLPKRCVLVDKILALN